MKFSCNLGDLFSSKPSSSGKSEATGSATGVHLVFAAILFVTACFMLAFVVIFVDLPNRKFVSSACAPETFVYVHRRVCSRAATLMTSKLFTDFVYFVCSVTLVIWIDGQRR